MLGGLRDAQTAVDTAEYPHGQCKRAAVEGVDVGGDLVPDDRELSQRGVQHLPLQLAAALQRVTQDRNQQQQKREQRHKTVVGDQNREVAALIVDELVDHRHRKAHPGMTPLEVVQSSRYTHPHVPAVNCDSRQITG